MILINKFQVFVIAICLVVLYSCSSQPQSDKKENATDSTVAKKIDAVKNDILLALEPPDSSYTGDHIVKYSNGVIKVKGYFRFGQKHSKWMFFHENGNLWSEAEYIRGVMNGEHKVYYQSGKLYYSGIEKNDKPVGKWVYNDTLGNPYTSIIYDSLGNVIKEELIKK